MDFLAVPHRALDKAEEIARRVWEAGWDVVHHQHLPKWLRLVQGSYSTWKTWEKKRQ